jgi:hypothetical protein
MPATLSKKEATLLFRICIGGFCIVFLIVLVFGRMIFDGFGIFDSISDYYYSPSMHGVFVGGLCILATLLMCYRYMKEDTLLGFIAGLCAIGVALFPKAPVCPSNIDCDTPLQKGIGMAHFGFAGIFFVIITIMVIVLFSRSDKHPQSDALPQSKQNLEPLAGTVKPKRYRNRDFVAGLLNLVRDLSARERKRYRNLVFWGCGILMILCLVGCPVISYIFLPHNTWLQSIHPVFWFETSALILFTIAWFFKGQVLLRDKGYGKSTLPLILTYVGDVVPDAIRSFLTIFPKIGSRGKGGPKHSQPGTSAEPS